MADLSKATPRPWGYYDGYVWSTDTKGGFPLKLIPAYKEYAVREEAFRDLFTAELPRRSPLIVHRRSTSGMS